MTMLDPKGRQAAIEAANEMAIDGAPVPDYVGAIIRAYIDAIMPMKVSGLVERLRQYEGRSWETTHCYNGVRDEAAISIENLSIGLATVWRGKLEAEDALSSERSAHAETRRERDEHKRLKNELVLKAYPAMDGADDLIEALGRYGFPVSDAAEPALMEGGSREAQALHKAAKAFIAARRVREGGEANG